jgi:tetratricopeptide (TPR) repeat protein
MIKPSVIAILIACVLPLCAQQPGVAVPAQNDIADGLFNRGKNLYSAGVSSTNIDQRLGHFNRAAEVFQQFLQQFPRHPEARSAEYYYALCFYNAGRVDEAKRIFTSIINTQRSGPYVAAASSAMAGDAFEKKDYATAAVLYAKLTANAVRPEDRQRGLYFEALSQHHRGKEKEALTGYQKLLDDPDAANSPYLHLCRSAVGALSLKFGEAGAALIHFEALLKSPAPEKSRAEAALYAGVTCIQLKDDARAEQYFQSVLANQSEDWRAFHADALTSIMQLRFNAKKYQQVIHIFRSNPLNTNDERQAKRANVAARSLMLMGNFLDAIPLFLEVQKLAPQSDIAFDASYNRLLCFYKIDGKHIVEQVDAFLEIYETSNKNHPRLHAALMMKAGALQNQSKLQEAADVYNRIDVTLIAESNRANLLYQRGWCLSKANDHQGAVRSLSKFLTDFPSDKRAAEALALRGDSHLEAGERDAALRDFGKLIEIDPGPKLSAYAWQKSAIVKKQAGDLPGMVACYETLLRTFPDLPTATTSNAEFYIGYGLNKQNKHKEAIKHLQKSRSLDAKTYGRRAGLLLISSYFQSEQVDPLCEEIDLAIDNGFSDKVSPALVSWAGIQSLGQDKGEQAARFFMLISTPDEPRRTPRDVWRNLGKALILCKDYKRALSAIQNVLDVEENLMAKADAFMDQARCHLALKDLPAARKSIEASFALKPQGPMESEASIVFGDVCMAEGKPDQAREKYAAVALFIEDARLKPLAISRLIKALEATHDTTKAEQYRKELAEKFPNWTEP